jgi:polar amino acid transport system permease protein
VVILQTARPNPEKRNLLIRRLARAPWWVLLAVFLIVVFVLSNAGNTIYRDVFAQVKQGIWTTVWVSCAAYAISLVMGLTLALLRRSTNVVVYQLTTLYVEVIRGIPTLVLVYFIVLAVTPQVVTLVNGLGDWMIANHVLTDLARTLSELRTRSVDNTVRAIIGLAISYSAFLSEVFRAGIESIDRGQYDAAFSLGMSRRQAFRLVILPQALRVVVPPLANDFIAMLKESSLVSIVGVEDITRQGGTYAAANFRFFESYSVIAVTYLVLTLTLSLLVKLLELRLNRGRLTSWFMTPSG